MENMFNVESHDLIENTKTMLTVEPLEQADAEYFKSIIDKNQAGIKHTEIKLIPIKIDK